MSSLRYITGSYAECLAQAIDAQREATSLIKYYRLQLKQENLQKKWGQKSPEIKELKKLFPDLDVQHGAGCTYLQTRLAVTDHREPPAGWELVSTEPCDPRNIGSPISHKYRRDGVPAMLFVVREVF